MKKGKEVRRIPLNLDYRLLLESLPKNCAADVLFAVMDKYAEGKEIKIEDETAAAYARVWCNDIDIALKHKKQISETNSINGQKGVEVKAEKRRKREAEQQQQPELFKEEASEEDDVPLVEAEEVEPYPFVEFWNTFNFKRNKQAAEKVWKKLNNKDRAAAMAAIPNYHAYLEHKRSTGFDQNNLYPATYLNGRRWEDDYSITDTTPQNYGSNKSYQSDYERRKQQQNAVLTDFMAEAAARVQAVEDAKSRGENI